MNPDYVGRLLEFHKKYNHHINSIPSGFVFEEVRELRLKLMVEELEEVAEAMSEGNMEGLLDGLADLLYVVFGTAVSYGLAGMIGEVFEEVHRSNMTKSMEKDTKSIKGKTIKGPNWEPPRIREIIERHIKLVEPRTAKGNLD